MGRRGLDRSATSRWAEHRCVATTEPEPAKRVMMVPGDGEAVRSERVNRCNITHRRMTIGTHSLFFREAGPIEAPVLLLPHGYPCSSYQYRRLMPALADQWRTVAFDWPGFGYSDTPDPAEFGYDFDAYAEVLNNVAEALRLERYALWLHDYGSQIGLRHAIAHPERIAALIIQNGDIYEDVLGPKYETIKAWWADKSPEKHRPLEEAVSEDGFREEFVGEVSEEVASLVPPDLWKLHWPLMDTPTRKMVAVRLRENRRKTSTGSLAIKAICVSIALRPWWCGARRTAICLSRRRKLTGAISRTRSCTFSARPGIGCWKRISNRRCRSSAISWPGRSDDRAFERSPQREETCMVTKPTIARIWRGRTRREVADSYEPYLRAEGIPPLEEIALGVQLFREDRDEETWFTTISYWPDIETMTAFTKGDPVKVHHLDRDAEFLIELPERIELHRILVNDPSLR